MIQVGTNIQNKSQKIDSVKMEKNNYQKQVSRKLYYIILNLWYIRGSQMKTRHKTHSSLKLATLLLRIDTAICRVGDMHSENALVHTVVYLFF